jgi:hypothetical protein
MTRFLRALLLCAVCVSPAYAGDQSGIEPKTKAVSPSFSPPITPTISGSPGADKYLQSDGGGVVSWAAKPTPGSLIPSGTGWVKQTSPGTFASFASVPGGEVSYSPAVPGNWAIAPTEVASALDALAAVVMSVSATASARAAIANFAVPTGASISTNNYLGVLGDQSATNTSVAPFVIPCSGSLVGIRVQRTTNATTASVQQFFISAGGAVVNYVGTGVSCSLSVGAKDCNAATSSVVVTAGDMLLVRVTGAAWSTGAGAISTKILCQ